MQLAFSASSFTQPCRYLSKAELPSRVLQTKRNDLPGLMTARTQRTRAEMSVPHEASHHPPARRTSRAGGNEQQGHHHGRKIKMSMNRSQ